MDSIENIRKNRIKLLIYSIVLLIIGISLGFFAYYLYQHDKVEKTNNVISYNKELEEKKAIITAENLLRDYTNYYEKILSNEDNKIELNNSYALQVSNSFSEIKEMFTDNITIDDLYGYYDYTNKELNNDDYKKPNYTRIDDDYYIDGLCDSTGNKMIYSDFKLISKSDEKMELTYKIIVMSVFDNSIVETIDEAKMVLLYENNRWKINKASIVGRCGLPYNIG